MKETRQMSDEIENKQIQVYNSIKEDILKGTFKPGTVMVERKLCDIYNVSRSPIRNALQNLVRDGLLIYSPGQGMKVPEITLEDIFELYDLLEMFQKYAVKIAIKRINEVSIKAFENVLDQIRASLDSEDIYSAIKWDISFHELLVELSGSSRLKNFYDQINCQIFRFLSSTLTDTRLAERSYMEHRFIFECLLTENLKGAEEAIEEHYKNTKQYYIDRIINTHIFQQ